MWGTLSVVVQPVMLEPFPSFRSNYRSGTSLLAYCEEAATERGAAATSGGGAGTRSNLSLPQAPRKAAPAPALECRPGAAVLRSPSCVAALLGMSDEQRACIMDLSFGPACPWALEAVAAVVKAVPFTTSLTFEHCSTAAAADPKREQHTMVSAMELIITKLVLVEELAFIGCSGLLSGAVGVRLCTAIAARTSALRCLSLIRCADVSDAHVAALCTGSSSLLQHLALSGCPTVTDESLVLLAAWLSRSPLQSLCLSYCDSPLLTDDSVAQLLKAGSALRTLDLTGCTSLTVMVYETWMKFIPKLPTSSPVISAAGMHCTALEGISLAGCVRIESSSLRHLSLSPCASTLTVLDCTRCETLTPDVMHAIITKCCRLTRLTVTGCPLVTAEEVRALLGSAPSTLTIIRLSLVSTNPAAPCFVPGFVAPPIKAQFQSRRSFNTVFVPPPPKKSSAKAKK